MGDAAVEVRVQDSTSCAGNSFLDVDVLKSAGITDLTPYGAAGELEYDIYVGPPAERT